MLALFHAAIGLDGMARVRLRHAQPEFGKSIRHSLAAGLVPLTHRPGLGLGIDAGPADERVVGLEGMGDGLEGVLP